ncbi:hypothetical protein O7627_18025 [Solwaraspora sp. WMMD1047]|uniref:hypothetical protein n=1 Tax=Solwaraspora sp. WMMD1047 TaxID=3016102 RepID=UPI002415CA9B|nr:hypothetical protein [Solwaraspora sp. WMMD1047]MDG4831197.1 hypothetical protein [Solwaraspora sp. WMMD1047]
MSLIEELAAQVRAAAEELPLPQVMKALEHLQAASDRLRWVRQESVSPMGVPELSAATEHAETAGHALRVAQEQFAAYLAAIGMGQDRAGRGPAGDPADRNRPEAKSESDDEPPVPVAGPAAPDPVRRWWPSRVAELTGRTDESTVSRPAADRPHRAQTADELLRRVATAIRSGDRGRMHAELRDVDADVGLGLAAVAPPLLRELATELLGAPPRAADQARLRRAAGDLRDLLPGLSPAVLDTLITRICRMPPPQQPKERTHPADPAVAGAVFAGLLLRRLGQPPPPAGRPASPAATGRPAPVGADRGGRSVPPGRPAPAGGDRAGRPATVGPRRPPAGTQPARETHG